jgi:hypothetical protein
MAESAALNAVAIRSRLVLEIACELVGGKDRGIRVAEVHLRDLASEKPLQLSSLGAANCAKWGTSTSGRCIRRQSGFGAGGIIFERRAKSQACAFAFETCFGACEGLPLSRRKDAITASALAMK